MFFKMHNYIIIILVLILFLSGCRIYNLTDFVMPDDLEFLMVVESLDTPKKIGDYMLNNFTYKIHLFYAPDPYILWKIKKGDCNDFATFGTFVANYHGYETYQIKILWGSIYTHYVGVYVEDKLSFTDCCYYFYGYDTFEEIVNKSANNINKQWTSYTVYDYNGNIIEKGINK